MRANAVRLAESEPSSAGVGARVDDDDSEGSAEKMLPRSRRIEVLCLSAELKVVFWSVDSLG